MPDIKEEAKFRDFLAQKYERKRWYLPASDDMHNEARRQNELADDKIVPNKALPLINKTVANDNTKIALSFPTTVPPKSQVRILALNLLNVIYFIFAYIYSGVLLFISLFCCVASIKRVCYVTFWR